MGFLGSMRKAAQSLADDLSDLTESTASVGQEAIAAVEDFFKPEIAEAKTVTDGTAQLLANGIYQMHPKTNTAKIVSGYPGDWCEKPYIWDKNPNNADHFYVRCIDRANSVYALYLMKKLIDGYVLNQNNNDKANVIVYPFDNTNASKWKIEKSGSCYKLHPMNATGYSLTWYNGTANGAVLTVRANANRDDQLWSFTKKTTQAIDLATSGYTSMYSPHVWIRFIPSYWNNGNAIEFISSDPLWNGGYCFFDVWNINQWSATHKTWSTIKGSWTRWGTDVGGGRTSPTGGGFGCQPEVGFAYSGNALGSYGGPDKELGVCVYIHDDYYNVSHQYGFLYFFPRVKISYSANGGSGAPGAHWKLMGNETTISSSVPTRAGYWFTGWGVSSGGPVKVAPWEDISYGGLNYTQEPQIAWGWNDNDGTEAGSPVLMNASQTGFTIYRQSPAGTHKNTLPLYAIWRAITFKVGYVANGARSGSMADSTFTYGAAGNLRANAFKNWAVLTITLDPANAASKSTVNVNRPFSRWATYTPTSHLGQTAAKYYADKAQVKNWFSTPYQKENLWAEWGAAVYTLPSPTKKGYNFDGFYTAATGGSLVGKAGAKISMTADTTAIGRWQKAVIRVHYVADGEEMFLEENVQCDFAYKLSADGVAACKRDGCAGITDFYTDSTYKTEWANGSAAPRKDLYLYCRNKVELKVGLVDESKSFFVRHDPYTDAAGITPFDYAAYPKAVTSGNQLYYGDSVRADDVCSMPDLVWTTDQLARSTARIPGGYASRGARHSDAAREGFSLNSNTTIWYAYDLPSYDGFTAR